MTGTGRIIDHVVMPVETLAVARAMFEALGFTVAPDAAHPFGTGNACVFLADGTYIEPLAVLDRDLAETQGANGNAFLRRDLAYRLRHALPGFSGVALKSVDAVADRDAFRQGGYDGGDILEFGRRFEAAGGDAQDLRFRLAFAFDRFAADTFAFGCQRLFDVMPDRDALTAHPNGATGLARLVYAAAEPERSRRFLTTVYGAEPSLANSLGFSIVAGNASVDVLGPDGMAARYGEIYGGRDELRLAGLVLRVKDLAGIRPLADAARLGVEERLGRLVVRLPNGGRAFLGFETGAE